ncbi:AI-2E family transporter [Burkholderia sp. Ax-1719]|uniref:AI-2E family transporter n=1 Tax=Burkholderia sp. Ax-1719 TaxID=2608334 RepID=UPI001420A69E|nr:AI-2E family transporter [Burkholderia sp. Ax-1719]NIE63277.1 AI-2E family transporter [Burkholderia sp. Ax-1719]
MNFPLPPERPNAGQAGSAQGAADSRRNRVFPPSTPTVHTLASVITGVAVVCGLYFGSAVLIPITLSVLLSFLLAPLVNALRRLRLPQFLSILIAVLMTVLALAGVSALIAAQVVQLAADLPQYQEAIEQKIETVQEKTVGRADSLMTRAAAALQRVTPTPPPSPPQPRGRAARNQPQQPMPVEVHTPAPTPMQLAQKAFAPVIAPLETGFIVLVVTIFILLQREDLRDRLISVFGSDDLHRTTTAINDASERLSRYFVAQLGVNVSVGAVLAVGLAGIGVPGALLFGAVAALLRFVPYIGIWIAAVMATLLAAAIQPQWTMAVWTLIFFIVVDVVAGQFAEPMLYGRRSGLSPLAVVVAAIFWSWLWGPIGLVLSTPLTLCIVTLGRYVDRLNFLTILLGDQPALTPAQTCYQRLLADDPHEALLQADRLLVDMPLIDYYEQVVFEGLRFARNDVLRGVLPAEQLARINQALLDIVEDLESVDDSRHTARRKGEDVEVPVEVPHDGRLVLCVPGRGAFDEVVAAIVCQLLLRARIPCTATTYDDVRNTKAGMVDALDIHAICLVSLDASESPPYLRNLVRRVRERAPDMPIVVGVRALRRDEGIGIATNNDTATHLAATLRDLVEECGAAMVRQPEAAARQRM